MWQEGIACASAVFGRVLLDAAAYLTWGVTGECDDVKGAWHTGCVLELVVNRVLISLEGGSSVAIRTPARKSFPRSSSQFLYTVPDLPGTRSNKRAVGCSFPRVVHDAGELAGPRRRRSWWCHTPLIDSGCPNSCESGRGHQMRLAGTA